MPNMINKVTKQSKNKRKTNNLSWNGIWKIDAEMLRCLISLTDLFLLLLLLYYSYCFKYYISYLKLDTLLVPTPHLKTLKIYLKDVSYRFNNHL